MLVLSRETGQRIIAGDITITLVDVRSLSKARIGIDAPRDVPVHRKEVHDAIVRERGPFPETRRVPVELLRRVADIVYGAAGDDAYADDKRADATALYEILDPPY